MALRALVANALRLFGMTFLLGCQSSSGNAADAESPVDTSATQCPVTLAETIGAPCHVESLLCEPSSYTCALIEVPIICICSDRVFECTDGAGNRLDAGEEPSCPEVQDAGACPPTEQVALGSECSPLGTSCMYASRCGDVLDSCRCLRDPAADGGEVLQFECEQAVCPTGDGATEAFEGGLDGDLDTAANPGNESE